MALAKVTKNKKYDGIDAVDLFCGGGGLTCGLRQAGIDVRMGVDFDARCKYAYEHNNKADFLHKSVVDVTGAEVRKRFRKGRMQREIDIAVRDSYGWQDIDLEHGFHEVGYLPANDNIRYTISEPARIEILKCLSALNRQRWEEEEAAGLHKKGRKRDD